MHTPSPTRSLGPPLLGALLRMPVDEIRERMLAALHAKGFTDLIPAHLIVLRWPGPDGLRPVEIAAQSGMSKQALNYLLGQLEEGGYLERVDDPDGSSFEARPRHQARLRRGPGDARRGHQDRERIRTGLPERRSSTRCAAS